MAKNIDRLFAEQAWRGLPLARVTEPALSFVEMQFPVVRATIKLSPAKKDRSKNSGSLFVVKEVKSANQRPSYSGSKVVEVSVPREALTSRAHHENQSPLSSVPLIELNINRTGFQVRGLLGNFLNMRACKREIQGHTIFYVIFAWLGRYSDVLLEVIGKSFR